MLICSYVQIPVVVNHVRIVVHVLTSVMKISTAPVIQHIPGDCVKISLIHVHLNLAKMVAAVQTLTL